MLQHHLQIASYTKIKVFFTSLIKQLLHELKVTLNSSGVHSPVLFSALGSFQCFGQLSARNFNSHFPVKQQLDQP